MNTAARTNHPNDKLSPFLQEKLDKSLEGTANITMREIRCPYCNFCVDIVGSDVVSGHKMVYCRKCKSRYIINYAHFRKQARFKLNYFKQHKYQSK